MRDGIGIACVAMSMVNVRPPIPPTDPDAGFHANPGGRFNILLTEDRARPEEHWTRQFPRLMQPLGVHAHLAASAREALDLADRVTFHAVFVDLATPKERPHPSGPTSLSGESTKPSPGTASSGGGGGDGGLWLLQVLQRRTQRPPVVVINSRATQRQAVRLLNDALRLGAFSVVNRPADPRPLLAVIQRLLDRHHQGQWPSSGSDPN
ncbi:MAG: hypothetical protein AAF333_09280 [Planctomycetota bacterium]